MLPYPLTTIALADNDLEDEDDNLGDETPASGIFVGSLAMGKLARIIQKLMIPIGLTSELA
jgi:hypothetical protein